MVVNDKTLETIRELNRIAEGRFRAGELIEAENDFRAALQVYDRWCSTAGTPHIEVLSTITGLVRTLEAQGRPGEAALILEKHDSTIMSIVRLLKMEVESSAH